MNNLCLHYLVWKLKVKEFLEKEEGNILEDLGMNWLSVLLVIAVIAAIVASITTIVLPAVTQKIESIFQ